MHSRREFLILAGAALIGGCDNAMRVADAFDQPGLENRIQKEFGIEIIGTPDIEQLKTLRDSFNTVVKTADYGAAHLRAASYARFGTASDLAIVGSGAVAYVNNMTNGMVFITRTDPETVVHELAHVWHSERTQITAPWTRIAAIEYGTLHSGPVWLEGGEEPRHGCVNPYGSTTVLEDIATFTAAVYAAKQQLLAGEAPATMPSDQRYGEKLDLLRRNLFISHDEQQLVRHIFET